MSNIREIKTFKNECEDDVHETMKDICDEINKGGVIGIACVICDRNGEISTRYTKSTEMHKITAGVAYLLNRLCNRPETY